MQVRATQCGRPPEGEALKPLLQINNHLPDVENRFKLTTQFGL